MPDCLPSCPCRARTADEAVKKTARFLGVDHDKATALIASLKMNGWHLVKDGA